MLDGFAEHEILCDAAGRPVDYRFLTVNPAFERLSQTIVETHGGRIGGSNNAGANGATFRVVLPAHPE
jgi:hypothetical protein